MSRHRHERSEKQCLNCGAMLHGHYCHVCGQENNEPRENIWHLLRHFAEDMTHFDGKFFHSLKYLLSRPGFLASEYIKGKRAAYLDPIRMYLLYSAIFLILMSLLTGSEHTDPRVAAERAKIEATSQTRAFGYEYTGIPGTDENATILHFDKQYAVNGIHVYDSIQATLPPAKKDRGIGRYIERRLAAIATVYHKDPNEFVEKLSERFIHSFSTVFLISLPLFALLLQLLYIRHKEYYYVAHSVFSIHFFCVVFLAILLMLVTLNLTTAATSDAATNIGELVLLLIPVAVYIYLYIAMKRFYRQGWFRTLIKSLIQLTFFNITLLFATILVYVNTMFHLYRG